MQSPYSQTFGHGYGLTDCGFAETFQIDEFGRSGPGPFDPVQFQGKLFKVW